MRIGGSDNAQRREGGQRCFEVYIELVKEVPGLGVLLPGYLKHRERAQHEERDVLREPGRVVVRQVREQSKMLKGREVGPESKEQRRQKRGKEDAGREQADGAQGVQER